MTTESGPSPILVVFGGDPESITARIHSVSPEPALAGHGQHV
jgi:hypothetical protein